MQPKMSLRMATKDDVDAISKIHASCWREVYSFMPDDVLNSRTAEYRKKQWNNWLQSEADDQSLVVLLGDDEVVGFCCCKPNNDPDAPARGEMHAMYVLPEWRGGPVGPMMFRQMAVFLTERDMTPMVLWAFKKNPVRRWYAQLGWQKFIERDRVIEGQGIPEVGYIHNDPEKLIGRLDRLLASSEKRRTR